ncbi:hypothetical protein TYRP_023620 [Tyrophagus putrescentiae]|nr:hypothetical protein TYRP_023620 [Tyrophagus putrescentiae]
MKRERHDSGGLLELKGEIRKHVKNGRLISSLLSENSSLTRRFLCFSFSLLILFQELEILFVERVVHSVRHFDVFYGVLENVSDTAVQLHNGHLSHCRRHDSGGLLELKGEIRKHVKNGRLISSLLSENSSLTRRFLCFSFSLLILFQELEILFVERVVHSVRHFDVLDSVLENVSTPRPAPQWHLSLEFCHSHQMPGDGDVVAPRCLYSGINFLPA